MIKWLKWILPFLAIMVALCALDYALKGRLEARKAKQIPIVTREKGHHLILRYDPDIGPTFDVKVSEHPAGVYRTEVVYRDLSVYEAAVKRSYDAAMAPTP